MGLDSILKDLDKRFGKNTVMKMSDGALDVKTMSSGSISLDIALGGGWGVGKIHEIFSESGAGKTGLALSTIAEAQKEGKACCFVDMECALNTEYAEKVGVNVGEMLISQPKNGEECYEVVRALISSNEVDLIVVDSVAAMVSRREIDADVGESLMGVAARMHGQGMRMITNAADSNECTVILINQLRIDLSKMFGDNRTTVGGRAIPFACTQRVSISASKIKDSKEIVGITQNFKVVKNKIAPPFKAASRTIMYDTGVNKNQELLEVAVLHGIVDRKGSWYNYGDVKLGQGADKSADILRDNPELCEEISNKIKEKLAQ